MSEGIVSARRTGHSGPLNFQMDENKLHAGTFDEVQITAPVSPGNSGGPVFNASGEFVAVVRALDNRRFSQNLNFAISASEVWKFIGKVKGHEAISEVLLERD